MDLARFDPEDVSFVLAGQVKFSRHAYGLAAGCTQQEGAREGAVRLRGGFGTPCDPVHSGFIEVLHLGEWGSICTSMEAENLRQDKLVADVVCRQLGFPHGTRVDPLTGLPPPPATSDSEAPPPGYAYDDYVTVDFAAVTEEAEEPVERFWLRGVTCSGIEGRLIDCDLVQGFLNDSSVCQSQPRQLFTRREPAPDIQPHRIHVACRQFPVMEALEAVTTPGAGTLISICCYTPSPAGTYVLACVRLAIIVHAYKLVLVVLNPERHRASACNV